LKPARNSVSAFYQNAQFQSTYLKQIKIKLFSNEK
jgi:hypothetical protein